MKPDVLGSPAGSDRARFLESVLDSATDYAIVTTDHEGRVTGWNNGAERVLGWREDEILGREIDILFTDEDRRAGIPAREKAQARLASRAPDERWHRRKDGRQFWATGSMMRLVNEATGAFEGYLKILRDRTGERLDEERRQATAAFLRDVLASSGDCIQVLDLEARLVFMNEGGMASMEVDDIHRVLNLYWPDLWPGEGRAAAEAAVAAARAGGTGRFQGFCPTPQGRPKWWDVQATPIKGRDGQPERLLCISRDMTERTLADRSLALSEARWRGLFERMQEGFFLAEAIRDASGRMVDFRFVEINPAFEAQTGLAAATTVGQTARAAIAALPESLVDIYAAVVDSGEPKTFEVHVPSLGSRSYEARARRESEDRFAVLFLDITERKSAEAALVASEERLRRAQTAGRIGTFELNVATDAMSVSPEFCRIFGLLPPRETLGLSELEDLVLAEDRHLILTAPARGLTEAPLDVEYRIRRPSDGTLAWIARRAEFTLDAAGAPTRMLGTVQDITARKTAEHESRKLASIVEQSEDFIGIARPDGRFDFVNAAGRRIVGLADSAAPCAATLADCIAAEDEAILTDVMAALRSDGAWQGELGFRQAGAAAATPMLCDIFPLRSAGEWAAFGVVARDLSERKKAERRRSALIELGDLLGTEQNKAAMAFAAARILGSTLEVDRAGYGEIESARETVVIEQDWTAEGVPSLAGVLHFPDYGTYIANLKAGETVIIADAAQDPRTRATASALIEVQARALVNVPVMEGGRFVALFYVAAALPRRWSAEDVSFIRNVAERTRTAIERLRAEEQQLLLNRELSHRMKNMLAMVQSIATQTLRNSASVDVAREALSARLVALGKAHDVLLGGEQDGAGILSIISGTVKLHGDGQSGRFRLSGPNLDIGARAALPLALMLHELATNAVKYGALSSERGHIAIRWTVAEDDHDPVFCLTWSEHDGPPVRPPERKGFGSRLIERALAGQFGGDVVLAYPAAGVTCTLTAPLARLQAEE